MGNLPYHTNNSSPTQAHRPVVVILRADHLVPTGHKWYPMDKCIHRTVEATNNQFYLMFRDQVAADLHTVCQYHPEQATLHNAFHMGRMIQTIIKIEVQYNLQTIPL